MKILLSIIACYALMVSGMCLWDGLAEPDKTLKLLRLLQAGISLIVGALLVLHLAEVFNRKKNAKVSDTTEAK